MAYVDEVLADSPWCYWRLGDTSGTNAEDSSPNNRDGTYNGSPTLNETGALNVTQDNGAVLFDATDDYCRSNAIFNNSTVTLEVWFDYSGTPPAAGDYGFICGCMDAPGSGTTDKDLFIDDAGNPGWYIFDESAGTPRFADSATPLSTGWNHIVGTDDGSTMRLYLDGVEVAVNAAGGGGFTGYGNNNVFIADSPPNLDTRDVVRLAGKRDEFAIYTSALDASRILAHFEAASEVVGNNIIAWITA